MWNEAKNFTQIQGWSALVVETEKLAWNRSELLWPFPTTQNTHYIKHNNCCILFSSDKFRSLGCDPRNNPTLSRSRELYARYRIVLIPKHWDKHNRSKGVCLPFWPALFAWRAFRHTTVIKVHTLARDDRSKALLRGRHRSWNCTRAARDLSLAAWRSICSNHSNSPFKSK